MYFAAPAPNFFFKRLRHLFFSLNRVRLQEAKNMRLLLAPAPQPCKKGLVSLITGDKKYDF